MLLARLFSAGPPAHDDFWYQPAGIATAAGARVSADTALQLTTVFACVRVVAESVAMLPLILYRREGRNNHRAPEHPLYRVLHAAPNAWQTAFEWKEMQVAHLNLRGNAYSVIQDGTQGRLVDLVPLHPDRVRALQDPVGGGVVYEYQPQAGDRQYYLPREILHLRGLCLDGVTGVSPIGLARESIAIALAAQDYAGRFFANDSTPAGILTHPNSFRDPEKREEFRQAWSRAVSGANRGKTAVLENGMKYEQIGLTNQDAQFMESRKFQVAEIARIFRVPPHMIGDLDKATFSNIEQQSLEFVAHTLGPWLTRIEQRINAQLVTDPEKYYSEHLADALLRGDTLSRYRAYNIGIMSGFMTRNEARAAENRNPIDGLDEPLQPLNMAGSGAGQEPGRAAFDDRQARAASTARREIVAVSEAYAARGAAAFPTWATEYYSKLTRYVRQEMGLDATAAQQYCQQTLAELLDADDVPALLAAWNQTKPALLASLAA